MMKIGIIMVFVGIIVGLCSMGVWIIDNNLFDITGAIAICGMFLSMMGLIIYAFETINPE